MPKAKPARPSLGEEILAEIGRQLGENAIQNIYEQHVLSGRTRRYELRAVGKADEVEIIHTLLGIELKIGKRRLICPDLASARYLAVFARAGCDSVAMPYDITKISFVADKLESSWHQMCLLVEHLARDRSARSRSLIKRRVISDLRVKIAELGAGKDYPDFPAPSRRKPKPFPGSGTR
ncbi:MAG: hypothetical protein ACREDR_18160 [Blastocatellia bacterium]